MTERARGTIYGAAGARTAEIKVQRRCGGGAPLRPENLGVSTTRRAMIKSGGGGSGGAHGDASWRNGCANLRTAETAAVKLWSRSPRIVEHQSKVVEIPGFPPCQNEHLDSENRLEAPERMSQSGNSSIKTVQTGFSNKVQRMVLLMPA